MGGSLEELKRNPFVKGFPSQFPLRGFAVFCGLQPGDRVQASIVNQLSMRRLPAGAGLAAAFRT